MKAFTFYTVIFHDHARTTHDLARVALLVDLAQTSPGTEDLCVTDLDQIDLVFGTQGLDQLDVLCFRTSLDENAQVGLAFVKRFGAFAKTASQTIVNERVFQDLLRG